MIKAYVVHTESSSTQKFNSKLQNCRRSSSACPPLSKHDKKMKQKCHRVCPLNIHNLRKKAFDELSVHIKTL